MSPRPSRYPSLLIGQTTGSKVGLADECLAGLVCVRTQLRREPQNRGAQFSLLAIKLTLDTLAATLADRLDLHHDPLTADPEQVDEATDQQQRQRGKYQILHLLPPRDRLGGAHGIGIDNVLVACLAQRRDLNQVRLKCRQCADVLEGSVGQ